MKEYHKIQSVFKRGDAGEFLFGQWSCDEFAYLQNNVWVFTEKVDGTNIRIMWDGENITFGGRTDNAQIPSLLITRLNEIFMPLPIRKKFKEYFPDGCCLYGEGYGAKIQKGGGNYLPGQDFVLFDIRVGNWWLRRKDVTETVRRFDLREVPVVGEGSIADGIRLASRGYKSSWGNFNAEGIVLRPKTELCDRAGKRIITKLKERDFNKSSLSTAEDSHA